MGGFNEGSSGGSGDHRTSKTTTKVGDFIRDGGVAGMVVRGITAGIKNQKTKNKKDKSGNVYSGETAGYNEAAEKKDYKANNFTPDNDGPSDARTGKSIEQPKVKSQMNNKEVKSDLISAQGPTDIEMDNSNMTEDEKLLARKRGRKTKTILTSVTGDNTKATLSKKVLLG